MNRFRIRQHDNHFLGALGECAFDCLRHVNFMSPLFGANRVSMQRINDGVMAVLVSATAGRQEHDHVAVDGITLEVAFETGAVDLDVLRRDRPGTGRDLGLHLGPS